MASSLAGRAGSVHPHIPRGHSRNGFSERWVYGEASTSSRGEAARVVFVRKFQPAAVICQSFAGASKEQELPCPRSACNPFPAAPLPCSDELWRKPSHCLFTNLKADSRIACVGLSGNSAADNFFVPPQADFQKLTPSRPSERQYGAQETPTSRGKEGGVPVYVMLPLDAVNMNNQLNRPKALNASLLALKSAGVEGIMIDVWWGIVEKDAPGLYNWSAYKELILISKKHGLKVQVVMSFHQCGGNVGDSCFIPLPQWVVEEMNMNPDLVYTDKAGRRNYEYLSLGCDSLPVLQGRTPVQAYADFMRSFRNNFKELLGDIVVEVQVGMGPAGEMRYPGYPERDGIWHFPGIGEFQCYDKYMLSNLRAVAESAGKPEWGQGGPHNAGSYNQWPNDTRFFQREGSWSSPFGQFFLEWYSGLLINHGERILSAAARIFRGTGTRLSGKVAGIHWHYGTRSHAAELTAGYYNTRYRDGYLPIARMFGRHGVTFNFTCFEMRDCEQPEHALCSPENLLKQVVLASRKAGVSLAGENALPRFDHTAFEQIVTKSRLQVTKHDRSQGSSEPMCTFTYLRMSPSLFHPANWRKFVPFVRKMAEGRKFQPSDDDNRAIESCFHVTRPLIQEALAAPL